MTHQNSARHPDHAAARLPCHRASIELAARRLGIDLNTDLDRSAIGAPKEGGDAMDG